MIMENKRQRIDKITEELRAKEMEATSISHFVGQMDAILEMIEFNIQQTDMKDYQMKFLIDQVYKAKAINDELFEVHKKNEINRIKKTYNNGSDEDK